MKNVKLQPHMHKPIRRKINSAPVFASCHPAIMARRFANPHLLREEIKVVTRAEIDADVYFEDENNDHGGEEALVSALEDILKRSIGSFESEMPPRKKRKKTELQDSEGTLTAMREFPVAFVLPLIYLSAAFRLLSGTLPPMPVVLEPKPPPPPVLVLKSLPLNPLKISTEQNLLLAKTPPKRQSCEGNKH